MAVIGEKNALNMQKTARTAFAAGLFCADLSLDSAGAVSAHELFDLVHRDKVEVVLDGVLQAACRDCELDGLLTAGAAEEGLDEAAAKAVAAADAVDNVDEVFL